MSSRSDYISELRELGKEMEETQEAYLRYIRARDKASALFCQYSNRNGFRAAQEAKKEALGRQT